MVQTPRRGVLALALLAALVLAPAGQAAGGSLAAGTHAGLAFKLYVPGRPPAGPRPLVLMLHGCTQDPDQFATATRMNELAEREGFLALYPAQSEQADPKRCWSWFLPEHQARGRGEPAALAGLVTTIAAEHRVDPARIYVAGLSAGGAMATVLAATYPDVFAAAAVCAGIPYAQASDRPSAHHVMAKGAAAPDRLAAPVLAAMGPRRRAVPLLILQGSRDPRVAPINADHLARQWAEVGGLPTAPTEAELAPALPGTHPVSRARWRDAGGRVILERWLITDLAHAWPGGDPAGTHVDPLGPSGAEAAWRFFAPLRR